MWNNRFLLPAACLAAAVVVAVSAGACSERDRKTAAPMREMVVYTALDRIYSEPILLAFQEKTGITVRPVYDAEAAKTTGLVNRLIARRDDPECDVLWNNEAIQTESLAQMGLLQPYRSPNASRIPARFRDPADRWTGFAARMRVIIYHRDLVDPAHPPTLLSAFTDPARHGQSAIALPFYGTTFTHVSILHHAWGPLRLEQWLSGLKGNGVAIAPGNGAVRDLVASGERAFGLTDTDDAHGAMLDGKPVGVGIPDPEQGAVLIPNTVALIAGCPRPAEGKALIDHLLSPEVERSLAAARSAQIPLGTDLADVETPWSGLLRDTPPREIDITAVAAARQELIDLLQRTGMDR